MKEERDAPVVMVEVKGVGRNAGRVPRDKSALTPGQQAVLDVLSTIPQPAFEIARMVGMKPNNARSILLSLQAKGRAVRRNSDSKWSLPS